MRLGRVIDVNHQHAADRALEPLVIRPIKLNQHSQHNPGAAPRPGGGCLAMRFPQPGLDHASA